MAIFNGKLLVYYLLEGISYPIKIPWKITVKSHEKSYEVTINYQRLIQNPIEIPLDPI